MQLFSFFVETKNIENCFGEVRFLSPPPSPLRGDCGVNVGIILDAFIVSR